MRNMEWEEYWLVDPREEVITTWSLEQGEYSLLGRFSRGQEVETRVLAGLRLDAEDILGALRTVIRRPTLRRVSSQRRKSKTHKPSPSAFGPPKNSGPAA